MSPSSKETLDNSTCKPSLQVQDGDGNPYIGHHMSTPAEAIVSTKQGGTGKAKLIITSLNESGERITEQLTVSDEPVEIKTPFRAIKWPIKVYVRPFNNMGVIE